MQPPELAFHQVPQSQFRCGRNGICKLGARASQLHRQLRNLKGAKTTVLLLADLLVLAFPLFWITRRFEFVRHAIRCIPLALAFCHPQQLLGQRLSCLTSLSTSAFAAAARSAAAFASIRAWEAISAIRCISSRTASASAASIAS